KRKGTLPDAVFFDFGGQDYYHGVYRAFLSEGAVYLVFWHPATNANQLRTDSNNLVTRDFALPYWLGQKKYMEQEEFAASGPDPLLLVQSYADSEPREWPATPHTVNNMFYVCLSNTAYNQEEVAQLALQHLAAAVREQVQQKQRKAEFAEWYRSVLNYILSSSHTHEPEPISGRLLELCGLPGSRAEKIAFLETELEQLHRQGLVLYYRKTMPAIAWLNPGALVKHIYSTVLNPEILNSKKGMVAAGEWTADEHTTQLLLLQKIIFLHQPGKDISEYIIPNFLPLAEENPAVYDLMVFGLTQPSFIFRFAEYLPMGLINQMTCFFGRMPDKKMFWRNQLLFTFESEYKALVQLNFELMEIRVTLHCPGTARLPLTDCMAYFSYAILCLYWNLPAIAGFGEWQQFRKEPERRPEQESEAYACYRRLQENEALRPADMYISLKEGHFVHYPELCTHPENDPRIKAYPAGEQGLLLAKPKEIPVYPFQLFTRQKLKKMKKIFISYSKKDLALVNQFILHLSALERDNKVAHWYCTELQAGEEWDKKIKQEFDQADIACFMVSPNFMANDYIYNYELGRAIERRTTDNDFKIVPIILDFCNWKTEKNNLAQFTALPYTAKPIRDFQNQNLAWYLVESALRLVIDNNEDIDWENKDSYKKLPADVLQLYERLINGSLNVGL
ncbi:MAG: TIR domain-containing protein, partial [Dinghuibacter sp.]|nr:TIR domain-containing protein [Dinghuibacter sp.]